MTARLQAKIPASQKEMKISQEWVETEMDDG
jgi:hypothetical protein